MTRVLFFSYSLLKNWTKPSGFRQSGSARKTLRFKDQHVAHGFLPPLLHGSWEEARLRLRMQGCVHAFIQQAKTWICSCMHSIYTILLGCFYFLLHYKARISDQKQKNLVISCHKQDRERSMAINCTVHKKFKCINKSAAEQTTGNDKAERNY